jgi:hypothetical protein
MDSDQALALLRARNRYNRELPSGLWARIALPQVGEVLASGDVPQPVLRQMQENAAKAAAKEASTNGDGPKTAEPKSEEPNEPDDPAAIAPWYRYRQVIVQRSLRGIAEDEGGLSDEDVLYPMEVISELSQEDFEQIFAWGDRNEQIDPLLPIPASTT